MKKAVDYLQDRDDAHISLSQDDTERDLLSDVEDKMYLIKNDNKVSWNKFTKKTSELIDRA